MKLTLRRVSAPAALFLATAALAQAHPGHDGHELTWDLDHLTAHPGATIVCFGVLGLIAWGLWKLVRPTDESAGLARVRSNDSR